MDYKTKDLSFLFPYFKGLVPEQKSQMEKSREIKRRTAKEKRNWRQGLFDTRLKFHE
jgi:hypothetical protein